MGEPAARPTGDADANADSLAVDETPRLLELFAAVLEQAIDDLEHFRHSRDPSLYRLHRDALDWVDCTDRSHAFTFVNVCEALGYEPTAVRRRLLIRPTDTLARISRPTDATDHDRAR